MFSSHTFKGEWSRKNSQIQWFQTYPKSSASTSDSAMCSCSSTCLRALGKLFLTKPVPTPRKISLQRTKGQDKYRCIISSMAPLLYDPSPLHSRASTPCSNFGLWACRWSTIANCASAGGKENEFHIEVVLRPK